MVQRLGGSEGGNRYAEGRNSLARMALGTPHLFRPLFRGGIEVAILSSPPKGQDTREQTTKRYTVEQNLNRGQDTREQTTVTLYFCSGHEPVDRLSKRADFPQRANAIRSGDTYQ